MQLIQIHPKVIYKKHCPNCSKILFLENIKWHGPHIIAFSKCKNSECLKEYCFNLPIGQGYVTPIIFNLTDDFQVSNINSWYYKIFEEIFNPQSISIDLKIESYSEISKNDNVIIVNALDKVCWGHNFGRITNIPILSEEYTKYKIIVITEEKFKWLLPDGVAEVWYAILPSTNGVQKYYPELDKNINRQIKRFQRVLVASTYNYPNIVDIYKHIKIKPHNINNDENYITFIWREDPPRFWIKSKLLLKFSKFSLILFLFKIAQKRKIITLMKMIKYQIPEAQFTVAGLGSFGRFPKWITDKRITSFNNDAEFEQCKIFAKSKLTVGVHGSNMLLPSSLSGSCIVLMPKGRWGGYLQDLVFNESNVRLAFFKKRVFPVSISTIDLAEICCHMVNDYQGYYLRLREHL